MFVLIELTSTGIIELFRHQCPEPAYDMLRQWMDYKPEGKYEIMNAY